MWQWLKLDRLGRLPYYGVVLVLLAGCARAPGPLAPESLPRLPDATVRQWTDAFTPKGPLRYDLQWVYETQQGRARGRAAVRFAPPDSLRFDYRAPFGRSGAAVLIGDSVLWAQPESEVEQLIPVAGLFWAAIGLPRHPPAGETVRGQETPAGRVWQFHDGSVRNTFRENHGPEHRLHMELTRGADVMGLVDVQLDSLARAQTATITFPRAATRFTFTVRDVERLEGFDPEVWKRP